MPFRREITAAYGDGIGPEIMAASLDVLRAAGAQLKIETIEIGRAVYERGFTAGIEASAWESLRRTKAFYKAPVTTPQGEGFKSLNVTVRKGLGLFANVRPAVAYHPFVKTKHPGMDVVIVRENEEDLYAGIEHRQTDEVYQTLKLVSRPGCERVIRYAFEYARVYGRSKVSCFTKDNIMKLTDGLFHQVFEEVGAEYPEIEQEHLIVDIGAARLAATPEQFDVIVMPNLYGDILSDVAAQIAGSVGLAPSANVGSTGAMFEAIHGSAPDIAGLNQANLSGLLLAGVQMLVHLGQTEAAQRVHNAWLKAIEDGWHTYDIYTPAKSFLRVGTRQFADAVISRLGEEPESLPPVRYTSNRMIEIPEVAERAPARKATVGVDVFVQWRGGSPDELAQRLKGIEGGPLELKLITNRGVKVWPEGLPETVTVDHWRARFMNGGGPVPHAEIAALLARAADAGVDFVKTEHLCTFDDRPGFSLAQGQ